ncbi:Stabilin-1 [Acipenser ruthenus]|uniref:Stabilin-1 n=1 Tax=Acipenser ruthenus TaxID=7906 RepID=A0A444UR90_ACIRT|nr:Stabilin-1 [Acipenser ruthenus]
MATIAQLSAAQQFGYHSCAAGWLDSENVGYPTTNPSLNCGNNHVGVVLYNKPGSLYDAYCYRIKGILTNTAGFHDSQVYTIATYSI